MELSQKGVLQFGRGNADALTVYLSGYWKLGGAIPSADDVKKEIESSPELRSVILNADGLTDWDTGILTFLVRIIKECEQNNITVNREGLPQGMQRLIALTTAVPERQGARRIKEKSNFLAGIGTFGTTLWSSILEVLNFTGELFVAFLKIFVGKARFRTGDLLLIIQECGAQALPIVSLISLLVGLILAFVGSIQLKLFGAQVYTADLVGIAMTRAMGAIMTGIIMAGRTGASFAARIGTMQVNEEIDALKTTGIPPIDFLVLPRVLALALMLPLLTLYADFMGILGGLIVATAGLDLNFMEYYNRLTLAITLTHLCIGLFMGFVFGILVSLAGCLRGIQCGRSASAVGDATTSAVVTSIVSIVVATAIITVVCDILGI